MSNVYMYRAALYCEECGGNIREALNAKHLQPNDIENEYSYDSDDYPKGPFPNGGGKSDSPAHCDNCQIHLENPLTSDGEQYVRAAVSADGKPLVQEWAEFYSYLFAEGFNV